MLTYKKFIIKHGNKKVKFKGYYNCRFLFTNNNGLLIYIGGSVLDLYEFDIAPHKEYLVSSFNIDTAYLNNEKILDQLL